MTGRPYPARPRTGALLPQREKRYGWYRKYEGFVGHKKWRLVSQRSGVHLAFVHVIIDMLFETASKARKRGLIEDFDFDECAIATDIPADQVAAVTRTLMEIGWIEQEYIVDWLDRQPDHEDPTATDRQRNKRARDRAKKALAMGIATAEQADMMSRVTNAPVEPPPRPDEKVHALVLVTPASESPDDIVAARAANERAARVWLIGAGTTNDYGPASKLVAEYIGQRRLSADMTIRGWLKELHGDVVALAEIIIAADREAFDGKTFQSILRNSMDALIRLRTNGPALPLGPTIVSGGRGS